MAQIISFTEHRNKAFVDAHVELHLEHAKKSCGTECAPLSEFVVFGYETDTLENEVLAYKGPEGIRVEALKALLSSFDGSKMTEAERLCIIRNVEPLKKAFEEFMVRVQVW